MTKLKINSFCLLLTSIWKQELFTIFYDVLKLYTDTYTLIYNDMTTDARLFTSTN